MSLTGRKRLIILGITLLLLGVGYVVWTLAGLPPVKYHLRYGLDPYCEPTGAKETYEGVEFVEIGPGIFRMGSTYLAKGGDWLGRVCAPLGLPWGKHPKPSDEMPVHWVEFRTGFWIATTEVTVAQYERFKKDHQRSEDEAGDAFPVVGVSWKEAKDYCAWLSRMSGHPIRLPSEAEWECACRAGSTAEFTFGDDEEDLPKYAWFVLSKHGAWSHAVATKLPNRWGLFDLHGNTREWCEDTYHESYESAPADGLPWTEGGMTWQPETPIRVRRGGSWATPSWFCRSAVRFGPPPPTRMHDISFRPAFSNAEPE